MPWRGSLRKSFDRSTMNLLHRKKSILYGTHSALMSSLAQRLKSSWVLKQRLFFTQVLNISRDSWQSFGCCSWSGSKNLSHTAFTVCDM